MKQVRKAIHYYKMVNKSSSILYIIRPEAVAESIIGFNIYRKATKNFNLMYSILCFNKLTNCEAVKRYIDENIAHFIIIELNFKTKNLVEIIKFVEAVAVKISRKHNIQFVATPIFRDELTLLSLLGVLTISRTIFSEGLPLKVVDEVKLTRPFFYVISSDIALLKFLDNVDIDSSISIECDKSMQKAKKILFNSIELTYSSIKTVELLQSYILGSSTRCKYCGAFSLNTVCDLCEKLRPYIDIIS